MDEREKRRREERMRIDGAMIIDPNRWPGEDLHVKTQPFWDGDKDGNRMNDHFDSISALVEKWSVD
jgi:hypothetical protein